MKQGAPVDPESPIAFNSVLDGGKSTHIEVGQHIPFPTELLDLGGAYH